MATTSPQAASPRQFGRLVTTLCALGAIFGLGLGGYATITSDNELGTVAAFTVGFLFSVVAILGRIPRLKFGDTEVDPGPLVLAAVHAGADEVADKVAEAAVAGKDPAELAEVARTTSNSVTEAYLALLPDSTRKVGADFFLRRLLRAQADAGRDLGLWSSEKEADDVDRPADDPDFEPDEDVERGH
jgi:hypothetical protein